MIDLTQLIQAILGVLAALITAYVVPLIKSRTTAQQQATLSALADVLVFAAEQVYGAGNGKKKLAYVAGKMEEHGFRVDIEQIEAAVMRMGVWQDEGLKGGTEE